MPSFKHKNIVLVLFDAEISNSDLSTQVSDKFYRVTNMLCCDILGRTTLHQDVCIMTASLAELNVSEDGVTVSGCEWHS